MNPKALGVKYSYCSIAILGKTRSVKIKLMSSYFMVFILGKYEHQCIALVLLCKNCSVKITPMEPTAQSQAIFPTSLALCVFYHYIDAPTVIWYKCVRCAFQHDPPKDLCSHSYLSCRSVLLMLVYICQRQLVKDLPTLYPFHL